MDLVEFLFNVSPDAGSGMLEALLFASIIGSIAIGSLLRSLRKHLRTRPL